MDGRCSPRHPVEEAEIAPTLPAKSRIVEPAPESKSRLVLSFRKEQGFLFRKEKALEAAREWMRRQAATHPTGC
jgi:hypothetical protein